VSARFYASAEYLALFRDAIHPEPAVAPAPQFGGDYASGVLTTIGLEVAPEYRMEVTYFGSHSWSGSSLLNNVPVSYSAQLSNTEVTLRHHLVTRPAEFEISFLIGARILDIEDDLFLPQATETDNELIGLQAGGLAQVLVGPRGWIDWEVKGAIADNTVDVTGLGEENVTSFIGETSVVLNYQFAPSWTFRAGYRGIWVTGLALAVENAGNPLLINDSGEMVYHGLNVGVVWAR
jgi:hypothetical protein